MSDILDDETVDIDCPKCGRKLNVKIGDLRNKRTAYCRSCKNTIAFEARELDRVLRKIDEAVQNLPKKIDIDIRF